MAIDSVLPWNNSQYIKIGAGNNHLPYAQAGFSFGEGKKSYLNLYGEFFASKGKLDFQKHNMTEAVARAGQMINENHQVSAKVGFKGEDYFLYGYRPSTLDFSKRELRQQFQTL